MTLCNAITGFDTISTALSWSVVYLVAYPEIQERLHEEMSEYELTYIYISVNEHRKIKYAYSEI